MYYGLVYLKIFKVKTILCLKNGFLLIPTLTFLFYLCIINKTIKMANIRVTKEFNFEIAHALWNYDGPCANIHGHSYRMFVTVIGEPINDNNNPKTEW